jgi:Na+-translocating ferredoxin:NAD+ oxidoreductase RnfC subunit
MAEKEAVTVFIDATTGPSVSIGQEVNAGQVVGHTPDQKPVASPIHGTVKACVFDADKHLLCLLIERVTLSPEHR